MFRPGSITSSSASSKRTLSFRAPAEERRELLLGGDDARDSSGVTTCFCTLAGVGVSSSSDDEPGGVEELEFDLRCVDEEGGVDRRDPRVPEELDFDLRWVDEEGGDQGGRTDLGEG